MDSTVFSMTARTLPIRTGGLSLVHQPTSHYRTPLAAAEQPVSVLFHRLRRWWRRIDGIDLAWPEQRRLRDDRLLADSYRWITR